MIRSFKLRFEDTHVRIVARDLTPGVDLRGDLARDAFTRAAPMVEWLESREPGMKIRSLSADLDAGRVIVTFHAEAGRPIVVRVDAPESVDLLARAAPLVTFLADRARDAIARR